MIHIFVNDINIKNITGIFKATSYLVAGMNKLNGKIIKHQKNINARKIVQS